MGKWIAVMVLAAGCGADGMRLGGVGGGGGGADLATDAGASDLAQAPPVDSSFVQCLGGHYGGTYDGQVLIAGFVPSKTSGTVDLTLGMQNGEFFDITNGTLMGMASGHPYSATLIGSLDCSQLKLVGGMLKNGKVTISGIDYLFEGPLDAAYDPKVPAFVNGTWDIHQVNGPSTGKGTWTAHQ